MQKKIFFIFIFIVVFVFNFIFVSSTFGQEKSWNFEKWLVDITIEKDSTFLVRETQTFNFHGNFHWVKRDIAKQRLRKITDVKVFDEERRELTPPEIEISEDSSYVSVKINFDLTDTQKTWTFEYRVHGGIGFFEKHDELYWNAVSSERDVPIREVGVTVHLPEEISEEQIMQKLFIGPTGSTKTSNNFSVIDRKTVRYWGENIRPHENFTIVLGWPKGKIYEPGIVKINSEPKANILVDGQKIGITTPAVLEENYEISSGEHIISVNKAGWQIKGEKSYVINVIPGQLIELNFILEKCFWLKFINYLLYIFPILLFVYLFKKWLKLPRIKKTIIAQYEPPDKLLPAEVACLIRGAVTNRDFTATLIDLAYRGWLKIIESEKKFIFVKKRSYTFVLKKDFSQASDLEDYEKDFLKAIFDSKTEIILDDLKKKRTLVSELNSIKKDIYQKLVDLEYLKKALIRSRSVSIFLAVVGTFVLFFLLSLIFVDSNYISFFWPGFLCWLIFALYLAIRPIPPLTEKGVEAKWYALGFREYLSVAERFRLGACTPETFEQFLSYAIVFGVEDKWANRFADIYKKQPDWYEGPYDVRTFNAVVFASSLSSMSNSFRSAVAASSPSSSSGFGGGGGAGGGGGGGGSSAG